jgi:hypothetical protein
MVPLTKIHLRYFIQPLHHNQGHLSSYEVDQDPGQLKRIIN